MVRPELHIPDVPHLVHIETTYRCNRQCRFCYNPNRNTPIDIGKVNAIVRSIYNSWVPHVYLIGGEPSLLGVDHLNPLIELLSERSSVTMVTNGEIYLENLSTKLACLGVPIHGDEVTHDFLVNKPGSYRNITKTAARYVQDGFDVRCIPVLTRQNHDQMYEVISVARDLGMESVFVDRYEEGGLGSRSEVDLKPSTQEFHIALEQMINARDQLGIPVGWGTAIPYCLDKLMLKHNMISDCGAGVTFAAVNPAGDVRVCNQSEIVYGNVLDDPIEIIWHRDSLSDFRDLKWVTGKCAKCSVLAECLGGCKVDVNCSDRYCIDYAMRDPETKPCDVDSYEIARADDIVIVPDEFRRWNTDPYTRINDFHTEKYLVTRYQTVVLDDIALAMLRAIVDGTSNERSLIDQFSEIVEPLEIRILVSKLVMVGAIDLLGDEIP